MSSNGWREVTLGDISEFRYGKMPDKSLVTGEGAYPVFSGYKYNGYYPKFNCEENTLIVVARGVGGTGDVKVTREKCWLTNLAIEFKLDQNAADVSFLYFYFLKDTLRHLDSGSAQSQITIDDLKRIKITLPTLQTQRNISSILSILDDKIEINRQMNQTLEQIAQAIFKNWFIDFEFPNEYGKPYKSNGGRMQESSWGRIPQHWEVKEVKNCGKVICGKTPPTNNKENYGQDAFFITIPDMRGQVFVIQTERKLSFQGANLQKGKELPPLTVCVSCIATPGLVALTSGISHTNQQINSIVCQDKISPYFMYFSMVEKSEEIRMRGLGGTATLNLNTGDFSKIRIVVPSNSLMEQFHELIKPLFDKILENSNEIVSLSSLRDSLLPKLISGEIRLNEN